jgi:RHS repeat-associated protein
MILNSSGDVDSYNDYYPYGMQMPGRNSTASADARYKYVSNERDAETNYDYLGARYYNSWAGRELSIDPFADKDPSTSPYSYAENSPVISYDANGDTTFVSTNDNGTYRVKRVGLSGKNNDTGVYTTDKNGKLVLVGHSLTPYSFADDKGHAVAGAVIDPTSTAGQDFVNKLIAKDPSLISYMKNATEKQKYDFKNQGASQRPVGMTLEQYNYRGSVAANGAFGSARDFGNIAAGIVAGRSGLSWGEARIGFDLYQSYQSGKPEIEGAPTQAAQLLGYSKGIRLFFKDLVKGLLPTLK